MQLLYRRLLLVGCTLLFALLTPAIVFYAIGYRYSRLQDKPTPVGVVLVTSLPARAQLWADDILIGKTPRAVPNLEPGRTTIRVQKDGYRDWQKTITVEPAKAFDLNSVRLFPVQAVTQQLGANVLRAALSPNQKLLAAVTTRLQLSVITTDGESVTEPLAVKAEPSALTWSPDGSNLLLAIGREWLVVPIAETAQLVPIKAFTGASQVVWDPRAPGRLFGLMKDGSLQTLTVNDGAPLTLLPQVQSFAVSNRFIYAVTDGKIIQTDLHGASLQEFPQLDTQTGASGAQMPVRLVISPKDRLAVLTASGSVWLWTKQGTWQKVSDQVLAAVWSPDGSLLLLQTASSELSVYTDSDQYQYLTADKLQLIVRLSRPLTNAAWFDGSAHVIYQVADELVVGEVDSRDHAIQTTLNTTNVSNALVGIGDGGQFLYYIKRNADQRVLLKADLLPENL